MNDDRLILPINRMLNCSCCSSYGFQWSGTKRSIWMSPDFNIVRWTTEVNGIIDCFYSPFWSFDVPFSLLSNSLLKSLINAKYFALWTLLKNSKLALSNSDDIMISQLNIKFPSSPSIDLRIDSTRSGTSQSSSHFGTCSRQSGWWSTNVRDCDKFRNKFSYFTNTGRPTRRCETEIKLQNVLSHTRSETSKSDSATKIKSLLCVCASL